MDDTTSQLGKVGISKDRALSLQVQNAALKPVLSSFQQNVQNIAFLRITPHILISHGYHEAAWFSFFWRRAEIDEIKGYTDFDEFFERVMEKMEEVAKTDEAQKEFRHHLWETSKRHLSDLMKDRKVGEALRLIRNTTLLLSWASFECLACDAWEAAVNVRPLVLGHPAFANLPQDSESMSGLNARSVSVGLLARHGFNIRGKLGTLLKAKFDFTGISGIRKAYTAAFGDKLPIDTILCDDNLSRLETVRHAIVHRAGIADDEYLKRTRSNVAIGTPIEIEDEISVALIRTSVDTGCNLLEHLDTYLSSNEEDTPLESENG